jgi:CheY-like chemotaxis protein
MLVDQLLTPETSKSLEGTKVLWVDDKPSNNTYERNALEALGLRFAIAISTEDGLEQLRKRNFDIIISDMGRGMDRNAGYSFFEKVKAMGSSAPFIIYAANGNRPENKAEAAKRGVFASVAGPSSLFKAVIKAHLSQLMENNEAV